MKDRLRFPILTLVCVLVSYGNARAAVRHWTGNGTGNAWRTAANWSNNVAPVAGDYLIFPSGAAARSNFNNFASGTAFSGIELYGGGLVLAGNPLVITNILKMGGSLISASAAIKCDVTFTVGKMIWDIGGNSTVYMDGSSYLDVYYGGEFHIDRIGFGTFVFRGDIACQQYRRVYLYGGGRTVIAESSTSSGQALLDFALPPQASSRSPGLQVDGHCTNCVAEYIILTGTGVFGSTHYNTGAIIKPGNNGPGRLTMENIQSWFGDSEIDLAGSIPGTEHDQIRLLGQLLEPDRSDILINRDAAYAPPIGATFRIFDLISSSAHIRVSTNINFPPFRAFPFLGATYTTNGYTYQLRWDAGDGNDVELQVVRTTNSNFSIWNAASSNNAYFAIKDNWVADAEPAPGHHMHFTPYVAKSWPALTNNFIAGRHAGSLFFSGEDYRIDGNAITLDGGITNVAAHGTNTITTPLTLSAGQVFHSQHFAGPLRLSGGLGGSPGEILIEGGGEVQFGGTLANTYRGRTRVGRGVLRLNKARFGVGAQPVAVPGDLEIGSPSPATVITENPGQWPAASAITLHPLSSLQMRGNAQSAASVVLEGSGVYTEDGVFSLGGPLTNTPSAIPSVIEGTFDLLGGNRTFMVFNGTASNDLVFTGMITNGVLVKRGGGRMILEAGIGAVHYSKVTLQEGNLRFNAFQPTGGIEMNGGFLEGSGQVASVTANGGTFSPGIFGQVGVMTIRTSLSLNAGSVFQVELDGPGVGTYDKTSVLLGSAQINGATLAATVGYNATPGTVFEIIQATGGVSGQFAGLADGAALLMNGQSFVIYYFPDSVVLKRVGTQPAITTTSMSKDGEFQFRGVGDPNARYLIQASPDLLPGNWIDLGISSAGVTGAFRFDDTNAPLFPRRYYRMLAQ